MPSLRKRGEFRGAAYDPTPEEIRQACLEIQAGWSPAERQLRAGQQMERVWKDYQYNRLPIGLTVPTVRSHFQESSR